MNSRVEQGRRVAPSDPTKMRNQPALRTSSGAIWLVMGAIFAALVGTLFLFLALQTTGAPRVVAVIALAVILCAVLVMIIARITIASTTVRLRTMAGAMLGMAAVALLCMWLAGLLRAGSEAQVLGG